jgi:hypothetical protein
MDQRMVFIATFNPLWPSLCAIWAFWIRLYPHRFLGRLPNIDGMKVTLGREMLQRLEQDGIIETE